MNGFFSCTMICTPEQREEDYFRYMTLKDRNVDVANRPEYLRCIRSELMAETCFQPHVKANLLQNIDRILQDNDVKGTP